mmetsp:Transcript_21035/g.66405  ORF Transcript_21035/g.66405 Transcript_21035/m.66405 type:complete len:1006 (+) Transcript_21035:95-3112(+)
MQAYEELRHLGRGAFGEVVLVRRCLDGRLCALKWLSVSSEAGLPGDHAREVDALKKLHHPGVLRYFGSITSEEDGGRLGILTEYADAGDLQMVLRRRTDAGRPLETLATLAIFTQLASAVQHLHNHNVMHRDLKPSNVLLTSRGQLKVGDFGVAKVMAGTTGLHNITCVGSPAYMAPEVVNGERYGRPCDVWSLGVVLYELCSLRKPFNGRSLGEMALRILSGQYSPLTAEQKPPICPALVGLAQPIMDRMLQMDTDDRADMAEVMRSPAVAAHANSRRCCRACLAALLREEKGDCSEESDNQDEVPAPAMPAREPPPSRKSFTPSTKSSGRFSAGLGGSTSLSSRSSGIAASLPKTPSRTEDLTKLPVRELKRRLQALGVQVPPGISEKPELVYALREAMAAASKEEIPDMPPAPPKLRAHQLGDTERALGLPPSHRLLELPVSELKWHLRMAGVDLSPAVKEKTELVEAVRSAFRYNQHKPSRGPSLEEVEELPEAAHSAFRCSQQESGRRPSLEEVEEPPEDAPPPPPGDPGSPEAPPEDAASPTGQQQPSSALRDVLASALEDASPPSGRRQPSRPRPAPPGMARNSRTGNLEEAAAEEDARPELGLQQQRAAGREPAGMMRGALSGALEDALHASSRRRCLSGGWNSAPLWGALAGGSEQEGGSSGSSSWPRWGPHGLLPAEPVLGPDALELLRDSPHPSAGRPRPPPLGVFEIPLERAPGPPCSQGDISPRPPPLPPAGLNPSLEVPLMFGEQVALPSASCPGDSLTTASTAPSSDPGPAAAEVGLAAEHAVWSQPWKEDHNAARCAAIEGPDGQGPQQRMTPHSHSMLEPLDLQLAAELAVRAESAGSSTANSTGRSSGCLSRSHWANGGTPPQQQQQQQQRPTSKSGSILAAVGGRMLPSGHSRSSPTLGRQTTPGSGTSSCGLGTGSPAIATNAWHTAGAPTVPAGGGAQGLSWLAGWRSRSPLMAVNGVRELFKEVARPADAAARAPVLAGTCSR